MIYLGACSVCLLWEVDRLWNISFSGSRSSVSPSSQLMVNIKYIPVCIPGRGTEWQTEKEADCESGARCQPPGQSSPPRPPTRMSQGERTRVIHPPPPILLLPPHPLGFQGLIVGRKTRPNDPTEPLGTLAFQGRPGPEKGADGKRGDEAVSSRTRSPLGAHLLPERPNMVG